MKYNKSNVNNINDLLKGSIFKNNRVPRLKLNLGKK